MGQCFCWGTVESQSLLTGRTRRSYGGPAPVRSNLKHKCVRDTRPGNKPPSTPSAIGSRLSRVNSLGSRSEALWVKLTLLGLPLTERTDWLDGTGIFPEKWSILVSGAGETDCNGTYTSYGTMNGKTQWRSCRVFYPHPGYWIFWSGKDWCIYRGETSPCYSNCADTLFPPTTYWEPCTVGAHRFPTYRCAPYLAITYWGGKHDTGRRQSHPPPLKGRDSVPRLAFHELAFVPRRQQRVWKLT